MTGRTSGTSKGGRHRRPARKWVPATAAALAMVCGMGVATGVAGTSIAQPLPPTGQDFVTRPDLDPPKLEITTPANEVSEGDLLTAPIPNATMGVGNKWETEASGEAGALISDNNGDPVWFQPSEPGTGIMDFTMQEYEGKPVLTWWQGKVIVPPGYGTGEGVIMDQSYNQIATVNTGNGLQADIHDFQITPQNTALLLAYHEVEADLSSVGGPKDGKVLEGVVQEVDIKTGEVLFDWRSLDHIGLDESFLPLPEDPTQEAWDYFHVNSVEADGEGNLLVSARSTHAVYQINRESGAVNWRLNGKKSDFEMGEGTPFEWQHDARRLADGTISIFDNAVPEKLRSRGLVLELDEKAGTAEEVRSDWRPAELVSPNMGNYQLLANGNGFLGWGGAPGITEIGPDRQVQFAGHFPDGTTTYRAYRHPWVGKPQDDPAVVARPSGDKTSVYASWNGATEVTGWRVVAGENPQAMQPRADVERDGFETKIDTPGQHAYVKVEALNAEGAVVGASQAVQVKR